MSGKITRRKSLWYRMHQNKRYLMIESMVLPLIVGVIILALWQGEVLHKILSTDTFTLPIPSRIIGIILDNPEKMLLNIKATLIVALMGLGLGSLFGYAIAGFASVYPKWCSSGVVIIAAFNAIPIVALAPVMTNLTKDFSKDAYTRSMLAKILVVMIVCMANMSINAYRGMIELKPFSEDLMKSLAASKWLVLLKLRIPNSVPYIFTALKVSVPACIISALVSEYFAEFIIGVGRQIRENIVLAQYASAWAYITVACIMGILLYVILMIVQGICIKNGRT